MVSRWEALAVALFVASARGFVAPGPKLRNCGATSDGNGRPAGVAGVFVAFPRVAEPAGRTTSVVVKAQGGTSQGAHRSVVAGRIFPFLSQLVITPKKAKKIAASLSSEAHWGEMLMMAALGWGAVPATRFLYDWWLAHSENAVSEKRPQPFKRTNFFHAARLIGQVFKIASAVYVVDCIDLVLSALGFKYFQREPVGIIFAKVAYTIWAVLRIKDFKKNLLRMYIGRTPKKAGKVGIYDRLVNAVLFVSTFMVVLDLLKVNMGMTLSSLLSLGGVGTLVFSFASKDLAEQLVSGIVVSTQERFYEGDEIKLGDGTAGIVSKIGWTHTDIRGYDEGIISIPNSQIFNQRVINLSRVYRSQVKQVLWFSYDDIESMALVCDAIKDEIKKTCPDLITVGRPFFAHWRECAEDHLELVVDCHFELPPVGAQYWDNRQRVLEAVARATKKCGVDFALPAYVCLSGGGQDCLPPLQKTS